MPQLSPLQHAQSNPDGADQPFQWWSYISYTYATNMKHDPEHHTARSDFVAEDAHINGSSSSLASALDERMMGPSSPPQQSLLAPSAYGEAQAGQADRYGHTARQDIEAYCSAASEHPPPTHSFGYSFPEHGYDDAYAQAYEGSYSPYGSCFIPGLPEAITYGEALAINTSIAVEPCDPTSAFSSASSHQFTYGFESPLEIDEPSVILAPPTAAQISRSSTLADAMKLPASLQPAQAQPAPIPPPPSPTPPSEPLSVQDPVKVEQSSDATIPDTLVPTPSGTPASDAPSSSKKRPSKTGRPRGRPPKHLLTFVPRNKVAMTVPPTAESAQSVSQDNAGAHSHASSSHPVPHVGENSIPGQSSFMLDNALPEPPKKKPIMACLFCRERKIACGPPPADQEDQTCKQCLRRELVCEWPTESKRGQHKRHPRVKLEGEDDNLVSVDMEAGPSVPQPPKSKPKSKAKAKLSREDIEARKVGADLQSAAQRHAALKRQRKLAAAQRRRLEARMLSSAKA